MSDETEKVVATIDAFIGVAKKHGLTPELTIEALVQAAGFLIMKYSPGEGSTLMIENLKKLLDLHRDPEMLKFLKGQKLTVVS